MFVLIFIIFTFVDSLTPVSISLQSPMETITINSDFPFFGIGEIDKKR